MIYELTLSNLDKLDGGRVEVAWQLALKRALLDLEDRPGVADARKVVLELELKPVLDEDGIYETAKAVFRVKDTVPTRKSKPFSMQARRGGMLVFNDLSEDEVRQMSIDQTEGYEEQ